MMLNRCMLGLALALLVTTLAACGGSSGDPAAAMDIVIQAPAVPAAEGWILNGALPFIGVEQLSIGDTPADDPLVGILGFDVSAVSGVKSAVFTFHRISSAGGPWALGPLAVDHIDGGGTLDPVDATVLALTEAAHVINADQPSWSLDVTALVAADVAAGRSTCSLRLRFDIASNFDGIFDQIYVGTSLNADAALQPTLVVTQPAP